AVAVERGDDAEDERGDDADGQPEEGELEGDREGAEDLVDDGDLAGAVGAEVALEEAPEEQQVPRTQRLVEAVGLPVRLAGGDGGTLAEGVDRGVDRREGHHDEDEQGDAQDHDGELEETPSRQAQQCGHALGSLAGGGVVRRPGSPAAAPVTHWARTPTSRKDSPVSGTGANPTRSSLLHAVGS